MPPLSETIATYCAAWDEPDPGKRRILPDASVAGEVIYVDPTVFLVGIAALSEHIDTVAARYPGSRLELTSTVDAHHGLARFGWRKVLADGTELPDSVDVVEVGDNGELTRIFGVFGPLPAGG